MRAPLDLRLPIARQAGPLPVGQVPLNGSTGGTVGPFLFQGPIKLCDAVAASSCLPRGCVSLWAPGRLGARAGGLSRRAGRVAADRHSSRLVLAWLALQLVERALYSVANELRHIDRARVARVPQPRALRPSGHVGDDLGKGTFLALDLGA